MVRKIVAQYSETQGPLMPIDLRPLVSLPFLHLTFASGTPWEVRTRTLRNTYSNPKLEEPLKGFLTAFKTFMDKLTSSDFSQTPFSSGNLIELRQARVALSAMLKPFLPSQSPCPLPQFMCETVLSVRSVFFFDNALFGIPFSAYITPEYLYKMIEPFDEMLEKRKLTRFPDTAVIPMTGSWTLQDKTGWLLADEALCLDTCRGLFWAHTKVLPSGSVVNQKEFDRLSLTLNGLPGIIELRAFFQGVYLTENSSRNLITRQAFFLVEELAEGTYGRMVEKGHGVTFNDPESVREFKSFCTQALIGLSSVHSQLFVMGRDMDIAHIKMVVKGDRIAYRWSSFGRMEKIGTSYAETEPYMSIAPELVQTPVSRLKNDIFSLGTLFFSAATGEDIYSLLPDNNPLYRAYENFQSSSDNFNSFFHQLSFFRFEDIRFEYSDKVQSWQDNVQWIICLDFLKQFLQVNPSERSAISQLLAHPFLAPYRRECLDAFLSQSTNMNNPSWTADEILNDLNALCGLPPQFLVELALQRRSEGRMSGNNNGMKRWTVEELRGK